MNISQNLISEDLQKQVEDIKTNNASTQDVYIKLAKLLFLKYQEIPTVNMLYNLVRKGSMTTVVNAMRIFWQDIQKQLSTKISAPDIPQNLQDLMLEQLNNTWNQALNSASTQFEDEKKSILNLRNQLELQYNEQKIELENKNITNAELLNEIKEHKYKLEKIEIQKNNLEKNIITLQENERFLQSKINTLYQEFQASYTEFSSKYENIKLQHEEHIRSLYEDIKSWQNKLDLERTQHKNNETSFVKQLKQIEQKLSISENLNNTLLSTNNELSLKLNEMSINKITPKTKLKPILQTKIRKVRKLKKK